MHLINFIHKYLLCATRANHESVILTWPWIQYAYRYFSISHFNKILDFKVTEIYAIWGLYQMLNFPYSLFLGLYLHYQLLLIIYWANIYKITMCLFYIKNRDLTQHFMPRTCGIRNSYIPCNAFAHVSKSGFLPTFMFILTTTFAFQNAFISNFFKSSNVSTQENI